MKKNTSVGGLITACFAEEQLGYRKGQQLITGHFENQNNSVCIPET